MANNQDENPNLIEHYKKVGFEIFQDQLFELANASDDPNSGPLINKKEDDKLFYLLRQVNRRIN